MTREPRLHFPSERSHIQDFYALKNPSTPAGIEPANLGSRGEYDNHWTTGVDTMGLGDKGSKTYDRKPISQEFRLMG